MKCVSFQNIHFACCFVSSQIVPVREIAFVSVLLDLVVKHKSSVSRTVSMRVFVVHIASFG